MGLTLPTVKVYLARLYRKLGLEPGAGGMQQLVIWYWKRRIAEFEGQGVA